MALRDLGPWLYDLPGYRQQAVNVVAWAACEELGKAFSPRSEYQSLQHNWSYLLLAASVLAQSDLGSCQTDALRIAQTCLIDQTTSDAQRDAAALILDTLANHPAIALAVHRSWLNASFEKRLPGVAKIDVARRTLEHSIVVHGDKTLRVNRFQRKLWDHAERPGWMSVSAPTSAGKSFILARWICEQMHTLAMATIVYLVPTRALISQVERDMRELLSNERLEDVSVSALPLVAAPDATESIHKRVYVLTQERLHILLSSSPRLTAHALIVDEAHKVGDRQRGVLLQDVVERISAVNPDLRVIFASPMTSNPGALLADAGQGLHTDSFTSEDVTVTQNLFWVSQRNRKPKIWDVSLCARGEQLALGQIEVQANPSSDSKRLSFVAHAVGGSTHGNIVYVNGAAEAEKIAAQLIDLIGDIGEPGENLGELIELVQHVVHRRFALATCLRRGVAFHYGNMPLLIREEIERLFSEGLIKYLVCTSTLIEGVNMACRNIFMRGPTKGRGNLLTPEDFWNLAGRAGRWGKEFQGNIFCIDPDRKDQWGDNGPPRERTRQPIRRTTDDVLAAPSALVEFIKGRAPLDEVKKHPEFEYVFSYLAAIHIRNGSILAAPWSRRYEHRDLSELAIEVEAAVRELVIDKDIVTRNPGISPFALDDLLRHFRERQGDVEELLPADPSSNDAAGVYAAIFGRLAKRACPKLGPEGGRAFALAILVTQWMRGLPLSQLIDGRLKYLARKDTTPDEGTAIRTVMNEVEQIARFEAPRGLSCYCDVLRQHLREIQRPELLAELKPFNIFLELGVSQQTQIALIGVGLSRTSAIALSELISSDAMTESQAIRWLTENTDTWRNFALPKLVKREIARVLVQHRISAPQS